MITQNTKENSTTIICMALESFNGLMENAIKVNITKESNKAKEK
jgi:hypothetical protein